MNITSTTDLEFPRLKFAIRQGEVKDVPANPEAATIILGFQERRGVFDDQWAAPVPVARCGSGRGYPNQYSLHVR
jgi:hypothetical protein